MNLPHLVCPKTKNVAITMRATTSLQVSWTPLSIPPQIFNYSVHLSIPEYDISILLIAATPNTANMTVTGLYAGLNYSIVVIAEASSQTNPREQTCGARQSDALFYTMPAELPSAAPLNITIIQTDSGVLINWSPPDWRECGGPLLSFSIFANRVVNQSIANPSKPSDINATVLVDGSANYMNLFELPEQGVKYEFHLCATNVVGNGPWSEAIVEASLDGGK